MHKPIMHPLTQKEFDTYILHPTHAVAIFGEVGIGKTYVALHLAADLLGVVPSSIESHPYLKFVQPNEKGVIGIEQVQEVISFMKLKSTGTRRIRRIVIIEHAENFSYEAPNALLKILEEPPSDSVIILTATNEQSLLPTIQSRVQKLQVFTPPKDQLIKLFISQGYSSEQLDRALLLSSGLPGLCDAILKGSEDHQLSKMIANAKEILSADMFTRLTLVDAYAARPDATMLVAAMGQIAHSGLAASVTRVNKSSVTRWHNILSQVATAQKQLGSSGAPKLVLANLFLHI